MDFIDIRCRLLSIQKKGNVKAMPDSGIALTSLLSIASLGPLSPNTCYTASDHTKCANSYCKKQRKKSNFSSKVVSHNKPSGCQKWACQCNRHNSIFDLRARHLSGLSATRNQRGVGPTRSRGPSRPPANDELGSRELVVILRNFGNIVNGHGDFE